MFAIFQPQIKREESSDETKCIMIFFAEINLQRQFNQV